MALFPEIDKEKTKQNVKNLLVHYHSLVRLAGEDYTPNITATYSFEPKSYTGTVSSQTENMVVRKMTAEKTLESVAKAMNKLNIYDRKLIHSKYMNVRVLKNTEIYLDFSISERTFYRELDKALIRFAEAYENGSLLAEKWQ